MPTEQGLATESVSDSIIQALSTWDRDLAREKIADTERLRPPGSAHSAALWAEGAYAGICAREGLLDFDE